MPMNIRSGTRVMTLDAYLAGLTIRADRWSTGCPSTAEAG
jgi:hypothetical protein